LFFIASALAGAHAEPLAERPREPQRPVRRRRVVQCDAAVLDDRRHLRQSARRADEQMGEVH
jgi:hypothetical protein